MVRCAGERYGASRAGRVFLLQGAQFAAIGEPGTITALREFSSNVTLGCAAPGPLRVLSGGSRLMRREGAGWVEENFAPNLEAVHVASPTMGYAVGDGVVYRWNGFGWSRARLFTDPDLRMESVVSWSDGRMVAVGEIRDAAGFAGLSTGALHYDGANWSFHPVPQFAGLTRLTPLGTSNVLAVAQRNGSFNTVARLDGTTWTSMTTGLSNPSLLSASDAQFAIAIDGSSGATSRFNGTSWSVMPSIVGEFRAFTGGLYVASSTFALAGDCKASGQARIVRWNGTTWTDVPVNGVPAFECTNSTIGTAPRGRRCPPPDWPTHGLAAPFHASRC